METQNSQQTNQQCAVATPAFNLSPNAVAALGYFCGVGAVVALMVEPYNRNARSRFHAFQSLLFIGTWIVGQIALGIFSTVVGFVVSTALRSLSLGFLGLIVSSALAMIGAILGIGMLCVWIYLIVSSANGNDPQLPKLSDIARKLANQNGK